MAHTRRRADGTKLYIGDGGAGATNASSTLGSGASGLVLTAVSAGTAGNSITRELIASGTASLAVSVTGTAISITLATTSGTVTSTVNDVIAKILATPAAVALVTPSAVGAGTGLMASAVSAALSGGTNSAEVFTKIGGLTGLKFDSRSHDSMDGRTLDDPNAYDTVLTEKERFCTGTIQMDPADSTHAALVSAFNSGTTVNFKREWGYGLVETFTAQVSTIPIGDFQLGAYVTGDFALLLKSLMVAA